MTVNCVRAAFLFPGSVGFQPALLESQRKCRKGFHARECLLSTNSIPRSKISLRFDLRGYFLASEEEWTRDAYPPPYLNSAARCLSLFTSRSAMPSSGGLMKSSLEFTQVTRALIASSCGDGL